MKLPSTLGLLCLLRVSGPAEAKHDHLVDDYYVLHLERGIQAQSIAARLGLTYERELEGLADHHVFSSPKSEVDYVDAAIEKRKRRKREIRDSDLLDSVLFFQKQKQRKLLEKRWPPAPPAPPPLQGRYFWGQEPEEEELERQENIMQDLEISDPLFKSQWHLFNTFDPSNSVNASDVWRQGITGRNVTVALLDDGIDMYHKDLKENYFAEGSWDFNDDDAQPKPVLSDDTHGTRGAGVVAAAKNDVCGVGVAYNAKISGIRMLSGPLYDATIAEAILYKHQLNDIYSCSWGPPDDGRAMEAPGVLIQRAMEEGVRKGRGGLGSIYVFASGNGGGNGDDCNFDGYANSIYSITIGAVDHTGLQPLYSEHCSASLAVTYSSGSGEFIYTTDVGQSKCSNSHGGTSAAAPLASGIFALALSIRPELSWRDLQYLTLHSAVPPEDPSADWQTTAIGKQFSHVFGYGSVDAWTLVEMAKNWDLVKPQGWLFSPLQKLDSAIPQGKAGLRAQYEVTKDDLKEANLERVEHVTVTMNVEHARRGELSVELVSPENVTSYLATERPLDTSDAGYEDWTFMSVAHWGESGIGKWTLIVKDGDDNQYSGKLINWDLKLWGEVIEADKVKAPPLPGDERNQDSTLDGDSTDSDDDSGAPGSARADILIICLAMAVMLI